MYPPIFSNILDSFWVQCYDLKMVFKKYLAKNWRTASLMQKIIIGFLEKRRFSPKPLGGSTRGAMSTGVDVLITISFDFYPFSAKKLAFFSKTNVMIAIFAKTSFVLRQKRQFFSLKFSAKIF
jgi:hypothetical protein